ncbi:MAG TPA: hypothetical protein VFV19_02355 [Candidatus Polarisedimenticolaceae bacterium]|nr:hypothetical protein [Candidatus Polarisedimenticolaceae bacterium]
MARALSKRERNLLAALALGAGIWMWYSWGSGDAPAVAAKKEAEKAKSALVMGKVPLVHMELLDKAETNYDSHGRDLFKYSTRPPSVAEVRRMKAELAAAQKAAALAAEAQRKAAEEAAQRAAAAAIEAKLHPPPPPKPQPPPVTFRYIGFVGPPKDRVAAFDLNNETFVAKAGEVVRKDYRIDEIRYESVLISFVNPEFKGQTRELPLSRGK